MDVLKPRILFIDSYDSFTNNLAALCRKAIPGSHIHVVKNDHLSIHKLLPHLDCFSAIIVGPGPGSPQNARDIGIVRDLWAIDHEHLLPIFGVCLGLQSLAIEHGAQLQKLRTVKHGQVSSIHHTGTDLFEGIGPVQAVRYHSLHVVLARVSDLEELAYADDGAENGKVVMALKHKTKPFWAVQYHPESVLTVEGGLEVMDNFWSMASQWNKVNRRPPRHWGQSLTDIFGLSWPNLCPTALNGMCSSSRRRRVITRTLDLPALNSIIVAEMAGAQSESNSCILLDSAARPGRYSIIGFLSLASTKINHYVGDKYLTVIESGSSRRENLTEAGVWAWIAAFMEMRLAEGGIRDIPFWGGLVGYLSYELGCTIFDPQVSKSHDEHNDGHPDVNLVFVERSVVLDTVTGKAYIQSILPKDETWINNTAKSLLMLWKKAVSTAPSGNGNSMLRTKIVLPDQQRYLNRIKVAKEHLAAGNSYELCLTAETKVHLSRSKEPLLPGDSLASTSWEMYKTLRKTNPAPHSAYLRLHPSTVLSSSPERFLSFSRPPNSLCQLRPIKGTLRKVPNITRADAERGLVGNVKEVAENLMIVDLIRHDLHGVVGENVEVKQFCTVEEYETVWQMVSVIEGNPSASQRDVVVAGVQFDHGWKVLRECLPPGSMTGAPKKRSVEILRDLEDGPRGIYSGVLGYWDVGGGGDWSVVIRSCFKHNGSPRPNTPPSAYGTTPEQVLTEHWSLGAGGAITALSDPQAEWDEMVLKLQSVLGIFKEDPIL